MEIGDNKSRLVWVKESRTSVLVIIMRIPNKQNKKKQLNKIQETKRESRATKDHVTKCAVSFHPSEIKTTK